jgi:hypothetical protein
LICPEAFTRLQRAQDTLGETAQLIITRGFEPGSFMLRRLHSAMRKIGAIIFVLCYPHRLCEAPAIFSSNGHDSDGTHVDVAISQHGNVLKLLPGGVLTPSSTIAAIEAKYSSILENVRTSLSEVGFRIHPNQTEALQIHCDLILQN